MFLLDNAGEADYTTTMWTVKRNLLIGLLVLAFVLSLSSGRECLAASPHVPSCDGASTTSHNHHNNLPRKCYVCTGDMSTCSVVQPEEAGAVVSQASSISAIPVLAGVSVQTASISLNGGTDGVPDTVSSPHVPSCPIYLNNLNILC